MGLINLQTNLKSLRFGNDRIHGGSSNQPYIISSIPDGDTSLIPNQDFILRGGLYSVKNTTEDVLRLTKYFNDPRNPNGLLFTAKQNLLSRTAVRTQVNNGPLNEGIYTPLSTLAQASVSAFGLHFNKQGFNPIPGTPGSLRTYSDNINSIIEINDNRLTLLKDFKILNPPTTSPNFLKPGISPLSVNVLTYTGGPGSILGIGNTNIKFATDRFGSPLRTGISIAQNNTLILNPSQIDESSDLNSTRNTPSFTPQIQDFRKKLRDPNGGPIINSTVISNAPAYSGSEAKNIENRVNLGDPGNRTGKNLISYTDGNFYGAASQESYDRITALALYQSDNIINNDVINDLVKFRIEVINNNDNKPNTFIHFRAFLDNINDTYESNWKDTQYIGRGEKFYTYSGFDRKVSLSWTVAAQSKIELIPMYKKLNYLASVCAPDYSGAGYMRGNLVKLTIGGYFYEQPGIITGLSYEMREDSTWEIGINDQGKSDETVKELPHIIKVSGFNFIPIHTFAPEIQQNIYGNINENIKNPIIDKTIYGPQRYIALQAIDNNYKLNAESQASTTAISTS